MINSLQVKLSQPKKEHQIISKHAYNEECPCKYTKQALKTT